jgi:hypothetical protein
VNRVVPADGLDLARRACRRRRRHPRARAA